MGRLKSWLFICIVSIYSAAIGGLNAWSGGGEWTSSAAIFNDVFVRTTGALLFIMSVFLWQRKEFARKALIAIYALSWLELWFGGGQAFIFIVVIGAFFYLIPCGVLLLYGKLEV